MSIAYAAAVETLCYERTLTDDVAFDAVKSMSPRFLVTAWGIVIRVGGGCVIVRREAFASLRHLLDQAGN